MHAGMHIVIAPCPFCVRSMHIVGVPCASAYGHCVRMQHPPSPCFPLRVPATSCHHLPPLATTCHHLRARTTARNDSLPLMLPPLPYQGPPCYRVAAPPPFCGTWCAARYQLCRASPVHLPCICRAALMHLPCTSRAYPLYIPCIYRASPAHLPCASPAYPVHLPCLSRAPASGAAAAYLHRGRDSGRGRQRT